MIEGLIVYLFTGVIAGLFAGLLGIGGGMIMVPALVFLLPTQGVPEQVLTQVAVATSLACISLTSISSTWTHHRHGAVLWRVFALMAPGLLIGGVAGAYAADYVSSVFLKRVIGVSAILIAIKMALNIKPSAHTPLPGKLGMNIAGLSIGSLSAFIGIGGGSLTVPFLTWCSVGIRQAVATAAACGMPIAWAGVAGFVLAGWHLPGLPEGTLGYVHIAGAVTISIASVMMAPVGAVLAHRLPVGVLKKIFAVLLVVVGIRLLFY